MDDVENEAAEDEEESENEYSDDFQNRLKILALSAARQVYCYGSIVVTPLIYPVFNVVYVIPVDLKTPMRDTIYMAEISKVEMSASGLFVGAILLRLIGRKFMVIAVNLSELLFCLYAYSTGLGEWVPFKMVFAHHFVSGIGFVTFFIYLSETTSPIFRAFFLATYITLQMILKFEYTNVLWAEKINSLFRNGSVVATVTLLLSFFTPETPYWSALKGNPEKAEETFMWLRAGAPDVAEFDKMLARAEYITDNKLWTPLMTPSFVICFIFSILLMVGAFKFCTLMLSVAHNYYTPHRDLSSTEFRDIRNIIFEYQKHEYKHTLYGLFIFLLLNFVLPRKVLYLASYMTGVLSILPLRLGIMSAETLKNLSSYCNLTPLIGIIQLNQILPVEIYPIALREIGVAFTASLSHLNHYLDWHALETVSWWFTPGNIVDKTLVFFRFYVSLILIPFLLILMPETKNTRVFEYDELKLDLSLLSVLTRSEEEGEDEGATEEASE